YGSRRSAGHRSHLHSPSIDRLLSVVFLATYVTQQWHPFDSRTIVLQRGAPLAHSSVGRRRRRASCDFGRTAGKSSCSAGTGVVRRPATAPPLPVWKQHLERSVGRDRRLRAAAVD